MGKAAELDEELVEGLKAAKSKRAYFALVLKGSNDGALLVSKTKVSPTAITEAKKESGGSAIVKGFCKYEDGKYLFETAADAPATAAQAVKNIAKRDAGLTVNAEFRLSNDPELLAGEPGATGTTQPQAKRTVAQEDAGGGGGDAAQDGRATSLRQRRDVVVDWLKVLKAEPGKGPVVQKLAPLVQKCNQALNAGDLNEAERQLVVVENYHKVALAAGEKQSDTDDEDDTTDNDQRVAELRQRRGVIMDWLKELKAEPGKAAVVQKLAPLVQQCDQALNAGDLNGAEKKLVLLENYHQLAAKTDEKAGEPEEPEVDPAEALREHAEQETQLTAQIKQLQAQLLKIDYEKLRGEFPGLSNDAIDTLLFKQSEEALNALDASNKELLKASLEQGENDPAGIARKWQEKVTKDEQRKDEIERKRDVLRDMQNVQGEIPQPSVNEDQLRENLSGAQTDLVTAQKAKEYYSNLQKFSGDINAAVAEGAEIGGADVSVDFEFAKQQAAAEKWDGANESLVEAHRKAGLVMTRKPYLAAKLVHEPKIKASIKIKQANPNAPTKYGRDFDAKTTYGNEVDAKWQEILTLAKHNAFDEAAAEIAELVKWIDQVIAPALKDARDANAKKLGELKDQLKQAAGDPQELRKISIAIFKNTGEAEDLGIDPGENARKPFTEETVGANVWNADNCELAFKKYDWFALKKCRKEGRIELEKGTPLTFTDDDMWKLVQYRGKVVNEEIDRLRKTYRTLIAKASGSEDIESDIDITFATPSSGDDVKAAQEFNTTIIRRFGKPAGRVFDVNIYPRDYGAIKESFKPAYNVDEIEDENIDEPDQAGSKMLSKTDQDVATLLKQRRFLEESQFNEMLQNLLDQTPDEAVKKRIEKQFEEGEDIYLQTSLEKVAKIRQKVDLNKKLPDELADQHRVKLLQAIEQLDRIKGKGGKENLKAAQRLVPEILDLFEETFAAETMDVTDALYLEKMGSLRQDQAQIREKQESIKGLQSQSPPAAHPGKTCKEAGHDSCEWQENLNNVQDELNALEVKVKKDMFTNIIFANEAIMSQGALKHVVQALQAKSLEEKLEKLGKLTADDLMQSVNEQVADLFKEMKHYEGVVEEAEQNAPEEEKQAARNRANGEGYVHASKYFFRLLDAAISLNLKFPNEQSVQAPYEAVKNQGNLTLEQLKKQVDDVLLKLRKSAVIPPEVKGEVGALEMQEIFPQVTDIPSFRTMISDFAIELNKRVRMLPQFKQGRKDEQHEQNAQREYGRVAETERDKALGHIRALASKPGEVPTDLVETLTKLDVEQSASAGLFAAWRAVLQAQLPRDLADLRSKLSAVSNTEAADELQAVVRWFEEANALHALSENQETRAVAAEISKAKVSIENAEKLLGRVYKLAKVAEQERRKLTTEETQPLLTEIERTQSELGSGQQSIRAATPQGVSEPVTNMTTQIMSDLQRTHDNLERRAVELRKV